MKTGFFTRNVPAASDWRWLSKALLASASPFVFAAVLGVQPASAQIARGTVMAGTGTGKVTEFTQDGTCLGSWIRPQLRVRRQVPSLMRRGISM
jgi:hypothetical protein